MLRKQTALNAALRLRVFGMTDNFRREEGSTIIETSKSILGIAVGYEWQMLLGKRWKLYYGVEVQGKRMWDNSTEFDKNLYRASTGETFKRTVFRNRTTDRISLHPLIGIKFHITPRFFVSTEMKMGIYYENLSYKDYDKTTKLDGSPLSDYSSVSSFKIENKGIRFQPYTGIYLNLTF